MADRGSLDLPRPAAALSSEATSIKINDNGAVPASGTPKKKGRANRDAAAIKRRCVSTACIACRKRKSKCDGNTPSCMACSSVYGTGESIESIYIFIDEHRLMSQCRVYI